MHMMNLKIVRNDRLNSWVLFSAVIFYQLFNYKENNFHNESDIKIFYIKFILIVILIIFVQGQNKEYFK